jgi:hypothetical protein
MTSRESKPDMPPDSHLQDDISIPSDTPEEAPEDFSPGQTNAGQQVGGLVSATQDPEDGEQGTKNAANNPI